VNALRTLIIATLGFATLPAFALSEGGEAQLHQLQTRWAEINYPTPEKQREEACAKLVSQVDAALTRLAMPGYRWMQRWRRGGKAEPSQPEA